MSKNIFISHPLNSSYPMQSSALKIILLIMMYIFSLGFPFSGPPFLLFSLLPFPSSFYDLYREKCVNYICWRCVVGMYCLFWEAWGFMQETSNDFEEQSKESGLKHNSINCKLTPIWRWRPLFYSTRCD